ncbi:5,6-dimethylbenzimidazole synthase [Granulicella sibirica]|uniref:5,6-dimethylbenzimidazole synthase n=1 Tax=Granulicella sibirica TaxID=2479048 RepID=A0A4Q0T368_9BACT|nr:5,6-dimethylbenzimidazole synthase [Granulicella sibirica]RXH56910.1 Cobalamin biosynthesis protein BluB [Granulicella sibirica]
MQTPQVFTEPEREAVYRAIRERRDVRRGFLPTPLPDDILRRLLEAAHSAPSVGLMQPWRFLVVREPAIRQAVHDLFLEANNEAQQAFAADRRDQYAALKLEGLLEAPQHLCIVCDCDSPQGHGLGRRTMPETAVYSTVCAIQNLWLAARAEGIGAGWVSILDPRNLRNVLRIPEHLTIVAYLCLGYVDTFATEPDLERQGWEQRTPLDDCLHFDHFGVPEE